MDIVAFKDCSDIYTPYVMKIFNRYKRYFLYIKSVNWCFVNEPDNGILAVCAQANNQIRINMETFLKFLWDNRNIEIEYLLLHEVRHIFQHEEISRLKSGLETICDPEYAETWEYETSHYEKALDENGKENPKYFQQDCEKDAFIFAFAIMKYVHKIKKEDLYSASIYGKDFDEDVEGFIDKFRMIDHTEKTSK